MPIKFFYQCSLDYGGIALALVIIIDWSPYTLVFITYRFPSIFLRKKTSDASNGYDKCTDLALGRPDMPFVVFFVNDGFHLGSTSMEHDFEEICIHQKITLRLFSSLLFPSSFFNIGCLLSLPSPSLKDRMALHT